ncbi:MAG: hypothetical protein HXY43_06685 [Fischerella sp.]|uniref:hypothetical protein n=1 Tax=Fischerella sp. TaxID=1191 RepID=UPI0018576034|nr:hypothetical protein [Fischerella sp.]NWF58988.1 hypothetical protein [Fischerella sp.]
MVIGKSAHYPLPITKEGTSRRFRVGKEGAGAYRRLFVSGRPIAVYMETYFVFVRLLPNASLCVCAIAPD